MRKLTILLFLMAGLFVFPRGQVHAQTGATCVINFSATTNTPGTAFNNKSTQTGGNTCVAWVVTYWTNSASSVSIQIEGAADSGGAASGSYTALTVQTGTTGNANPATGTTSGVIIACCDSYPWIRLNPTTLSGAGVHLTARALGYVNTSAAKGAGGGGAPSGPAGGDLAGTYPNPTVVHLGNVTDSSLKNSGLVNPATTVNGQTCTLGSSCTVTSGPTGTAGGDLSGSYPNPTVAKVNGTSVPTNAAANQVPVTTSAATAAWETLPSCADTGGNHLNFDTTAHTFSCGTSGGVGGAPIFPPNAKTSTYQALASDFTNCKVVTVASGTFTVTLVASTSQPSNGQCMWVINYGSGVVTVARSGQNINGGTSSLTLPAASATAPTGAFIVSDASNYFAQLFGSGSPSGTAGGDLSGTYPNPTVAKVNGNTPGGSCSAGDFVSSVDTSARPTCTTPAGSSGSFVLVEQHTASTSAELDFTTCISATYDDYQIEIVQLIPDTDVKELKMQFGVGSSYDTGNNYAWSNWVVTSGAASGGDGANTTNAMIVSPVQFYNGANYSMNGTFHFSGPASSIFKGVYGSFQALDDRNVAGAQTNAYMMSGIYRITTAVTSFRFLMSTGNITSGTIRCYGLAK